MTIEVGDKVIVFNAGSDYSYAKKILPVEVGDKVDVFTLSDGTRIPLPRISLDLSDYVFLVPSIPKLEMPPLSVVINTIGWGTITNHWENPPADAVNKNWVEDTTQARTAGSLVGKYMCMVTGKNAKKYYAISANTDTRITFGVEVNEGLAFGSGYTPVLDGYADSWILNTGEFSVAVGGSIRLPYDIWKDYIAVNSTVTLQVQVNRSADTNPYENLCYLYFYNNLPNPPSSAKRYVPDTPGAYLFEWDLTAIYGRDLVFIVWVSGSYGRYAGVAQGVGIKQASYPNFTIGDRYLILAALPT
jgi:hypothetical protein